MPVLSGKSGSITLDSSQIQVFTNGTFRYGPEIQTYTAVSGAGAQETVEGVVRGSGTIDVVVSSTELISQTVAPGALVSASWEFASGTAATGNMRLGQFEWQMNRDGTIQRATIPFETDGTWTFPS